MAQPKYDSNTGMPVYSVQTDQPAYECVEFDCLDCTGDMQAVFSGVSVTNCTCNITGPSSSEKITAISGINGTHTLSYDGPGCQWLLTDVGSITFTFYEDQTCTTSNGTFTTDMFIKLTYSTTLGWELEVGAQSSVPFYRQVFLGENTTQECPDGMAFTDYAQCSPGASATVTEL